MTDATPGNARTIKYAGEYIRARDIRKINAYAAEHRIGPALLGLYVTMAAKPETWRFAADRLGREVGCGRTAVQTLLCALEELGYLVRRRVQDNRGHWGWLVIFDQHGVDLAEHDLPAEDRSPEMDPRSDLGEQGKPAGHTEGWLTDFGQPGFSVVDLPSHDLEKSSQGLDVTSNDDEQPEPNPGSDERTWLADVVDLLGADAPAVDPGLVRHARSWNLAGWTPATAVVELLRDINRGAARNVPALIAGRLRQGPPRTFVPEPRQPYERSVSEAFSDRACERCTRCTLPRQNWRHDPDSGPEGHPYETRALALA